MPIPQQRDGEVARKSLTDWLAARLGAPDVAITVHGGPADTGFSSDTIIFDANWTEAGEARAQAFVARAAPMGEAVFPEYEMDLQFRVISALHAHTDVPVPRPFWLEEDSSVLGAQFFVMERIDGRAPADNPPYTMEGWLLEATPDQQRALWCNGLDVLARIHRVDWRLLGLRALERPGLGRPGLDQRLAYFRRYLDWVARGTSNPWVEAARDWCEANRPDDDDLVGLCWGDARIGNMLFGPDFGVAAVLDWEMVNLANPEQDLAWYLFFREHFADALGVPDVPGFPTRDESVARWEAAVGRRAEHLDYYRVLAGYFFGMIMMAVTNSNIAHGVLPPDTDLGVNNICTKMLAEMLDIPGPGVTGTADITWPATD